MRRAAGGCSFQVVGFDQFALIGVTYVKVIANGNTIISADVNGHGKADFSIGPQAITC